MVIKLTLIGVFAIAADAGGISDPSGRGLIFQYALSSLNIFCFARVMIQLKMTGFLSRILEIHLRLPGHLSIIPKPDRKTFLITCHTA